MDSPWRVFFPDAQLYQSNENFSRAAAADRLGWMENSDYMEALDFSRMSFREWKEFCAVLNEE